MTKSFKLSTEFYNDLITFQSAIDILNSAEKALEDKYEKLKKNVPELRQKQIDDGKALVVELNALSEKIKLGTEEKAMILIGYLNQQKLMVEAKYFAKSRADNSALHKSIKEKFEALSPEVLAYANAAYQNLLNFKKLNVNIPSDEEKAKMVRRNKQLRGDYNWKDRKIEDNKDESRKERLPSESKVIGNSVNKSTQHLIDINLRTSRKTTGTGMSTRKRTYAEAATNTNKPAEVVDALRDLNDNLEQRKQAMFKEMFANKHWHFKNGSEPSLLKKVYGFFTASDKKPAENKQEAKAEAGQNHVAVKRK